MEPIFVCPIVLLLCFAARLSKAAQPLSIPPSEYWDGDDGSWSTFWLQVGTPPQTVRLLPGTSASAGTAIWTVITQGCTLLNQNIPDCTTLRNVFNPNESSSWSIRDLGNDGLFGLNAIEEGRLGLNGNAYYGFDNIQFGVPGSGLPSLTPQLVAGIATNDYWLGSLGLSPWPFNFTNFNNPIPTLLTTLRDKRNIPSLSWGYTAGASYSDPPSFGSLTLGGYDSSRFDAGNAVQDMPFGADISRDLLLTLSDVRYDGGESLLPQSINIFIDSMVSQMWLPIESCKKFEDAFRLVWNPDAEFYIVDEETHSSLEKQNPRFTFTFADGQGGSAGVVFPYAAFDLNLTGPLSSSNERYFPLKRAEDSSQYTLGRVFLQEAYVVADYTRSTFSVGQAIHADSSASQDLVAIQSPGGSNTLGAGAIAGIAVAAAAVLLAIAAFAFVRYRREKKRREQRQSGPTISGAKLAPSSSMTDHKGDLWASATSELDSRDLHEMEPGGRPSELNGMKLAHELHAHSPPVELDGRPLARQHTVVER